MKSGYGLTMAADGNLSVDSKSQAGYTKNCPKISSVAWFALREGVYEPLAPDKQGIWRSELLPGLWLDAAAFWNDDLPALLQTLQ